MDSISGNQQPGGLNKNVIALSIQQPWAELILRGLKTIEVRRVPARPRGQVYLYSSRRPARFPGVQELMTRHGISLAALPLGQIVGRVEILECRRGCPEDVAAAHVPAAMLKDAYSWILGNPARFTQPVQPKFVPFGTWFYPFQRMRTNVRHRR